MSTQSPITPDTHGPRSPIWNSEITAVEVFYPGSLPGDPFEHVFIVRDSQRPQEWQCHVAVAIPGMKDTHPCFRTEEIVKMIRNAPLTSSSERPRRTRSHRLAPQSICRADVCSVRILYDGRCAFLDRSLRDRHTWRGDGITLTTEEITRMMPYFYGYR